MRHLNRITVTAVLLLSCVGVAARPFAGSETWVHAGGKVRGVIITLACEAIPDARISFSDKKRTQLVTPDRRGRFLVELPAGKYQVSVFVQGRGEVTAEELVLEPTRGGELRLHVDTGVEILHGCFGTHPEDLLIPDERVVVSDKLPGGPAASEP